jgi:hypothetical protein
MLAPLAVLGGALGFDMLAYLDNSIQNFLRYFILAFPLGVLLVGALVATVQGHESAGVDASSRARTRPRQHRARLRILGVLAGVMLVLVVMIPTTVTTASAMFNPNTGRLETEQLGFVLRAHPSRADIDEKDNYGWILAMGDWFTNRHLPDGDVVVDNFPECIPPLLTTINQPKLFVIPNDRDYQRTLADPITFHAHYILEADPAAFPNTSINIEFPSLWRTGTEFTKMVHTFPSRAACPEFRLFHVLGHSNEVG